MVKKIIVKGLFNVNTGEEIKMKTSHSVKYISYVGLLVAGILLGWLLFRNNQNEPVKTESTDSQNKTIWTCSMHPQIRKDEPGKCPICGMDLIPLNQLKSDTVAMDPMAIHLTPEAIQLANVMTSKVSKQKPIKELRLYGKIQADERLIQSQTAHIPGRIERLMVNFTGEQVRRGQPLAEIYSPELITAQQELIQASQMKETQPAIYEASVDRLLQWKLSEDQVKSIEQAGKIRNTFPINSTSSGIVTSRRVNNGDYVSQGSVLYDIADLSTVWAMFDAYESDLPFLSVGDKIDFTSQALPGLTFTGKIDFIDPVIDPVARVAKVRLQINNSGGKLKPEMFVTGVLQADLSKFNGYLVIPKSAVLWTGKRSIVYVKLPGEVSSYKMREIEIGPSLGNGFVVMNGLQEGEEIVTSGTFNVDAAAQLEGKPSMMNPEGELMSTGHDHGQMQMPNVKENNNLKKNDGNHQDHGMEGMEGMQGMQSNSERDQAPVNQTITTEHEIFKVSGNCTMCEDRIEKAAKSVPGVKVAVWDVNTKNLNLEFNPSQTSVDKVKKAIAAVGHDTEEYKADNNTYLALPDCCKYRN